MMPRPLHWKKGITVSIRNEYIVVYTHPTCSIMDDYGKDFGGDNYDSQSGIFKEEFTSIKVNIVLLLMNCTYSGNRELIAVLCALHIHASNNNISNDSNGCS